MGDATGLAGSAGDQLPQGSRPAQFPELEQVYSENPTVSDAPIDLTRNMQQMYGNPQQAFSSQMEMSQAQGSAGSAPYNMAALANALPQAGYRAAQIPSTQQQRFYPAVSSPSMAASMQLPQYPGQPGLGGLPNQQYYLAQHPQMGHYYAAPISPSQQQHQHQQQQAPSPPRANMGMYANQFIMNHQQQQPQSAQYYYPQQYVQQNPTAQGRVMLGQYMATGASAVDPRLSQPQAMFEQPGSSPLGLERSADRGEARSNVVRGPPRKPRQSGHAIWIGNLPPQTELMSLVHHVCKEAPGLESLFLISKSNCAFANYKDEQTCAAAQQKLHDSKFQSVRLVSRLRKSAVESASGVSAPTGPAASTARGGGSTAATLTDGAQPQAQTQTDLPALEDADKTPPAVQRTSSESQPQAPPLPQQQMQGEMTPPKDRFFILKSLTVEDLELSVRTGIWATQSHNEENLNKAFQAVDNVYLIFSANKSGEYFGYARMVSPINEDPAAAIEFAPKAQSTSDFDLPKAIPTEATEFAPRGRIIDDSARGTIFWEAEHEDNIVTNSGGGGGGGTASGGDAAGSSGGQDDEAGSAPGTSSAGDDSSSVRSSGNDESGAQDKDSISGGGESKAWGKPFKLEWLSVARLPFYRTRGLRNPWNSNREVKIARDGTELEPSVGRKLIGLFNRVQSPGPPAQLIGLGMGVGGGVGGGTGAVGGQMPSGPGAMGMMPGYPPAMRTAYPR